jgi:hypothetical protein
MIEAVLKDIELACGAEKILFGKGDLELAEGLKVKIIL